MKSNKRVWYALAALAVSSLVGDFVCRSMARSGDQERLMRSAGEAVSRLPETIGRWRLEASEPLDDTALRMLECRAYQSRQYTHETTGEKVNFLLLVGPAGTLVAHTPEVCYTSTDFQLFGKTRVETVRGSGAQADSFGSVALKSKSLNWQNQLVYYAWRPYGGHWQAPANPRLSLCGHPMLYKLQLSVSAPDLGAPAPAERNAAERFLADSLPVLDRILTSE
jgi:hypothetical protein